METKAPKKKSLTLKGLVFFELAVLLAAGAVLLLGEMLLTLETQKGILTRRLEHISSSYARSLQAEQDVEELYTRTMSARADALAHILDYDDPCSDDLLKLFGRNAEIVYNDGEPRESGKRYFSAERQDGSYVTIVQSEEILDRLLDNLHTRKDVLDSAGKDETMLFFAVDADGSVPYYEGVKYLDKDISSLGTDMEDLPIDGDKWLRVNGKLYYLAGRSGASGETAFFCGIPVIELLNNCLSAVGIIFGCFAVFLTGLFTYVFFASQEEETRRNRGNSYSKDAVRRKAFIIASAVILALGLVTFLVQTLANLTLFTINSDSTLREVSAHMDHAETSYEALKEDYNQRFLNETRIIAGILTEYPELRTKEELQTLTDLFGLEYIMLFDSSGAETLSDSHIIRFRLSENPEEQSYEFRPLLNGVDYVIQDARQEELSGEYRQFIGVPLFNERDEADGFVQIAVSPDGLKRMEGETSLQNYLELSHSWTGAELLAVNAESGEVSYASMDKSLQEKKAADLGISEEQQKERYFGRIRFDGNYYQVNATRIGDSYIYVAAPEVRLFRGRLSMVLLTVLVFLSVVALFTGFFHRRGVRKIHRTPDDPHIDVMTSEGREKSALNIIARMMHTRISWQERLPEEKAFYAADLVLFFFGIVIFARLLFGDAGYMDVSVLGLLKSGKWVRGFNAFAFADVLVNLFIYFLLMSVVNWILELQIEIVNPGLETMIRLTKSVINYTAFFAFLFYSLYILGFDSWTLLASAGVLSLAVSLGSKDLITDILAGLFIIFEKDLQVGDIIQVDDFSGTVLEIGLRTTKIMDLSQNIKAVNNRNLTNVINKTRKISYCDILLPVSLRNSLEDIEKMLEQELPELRKSSKYLIRGPYYCGVHEITNSFMILNIRSECREEHLYKVKTVINGKLIELFEKKGYTIGI